MVKLKKISFPKVSFSKIKERLRSLFQVTPKTKIEATRPRFRAEPLVAVIEGEVLDKYTIDQAVVFIVDRDGRGYYLVHEPPLNEEEQRIYGLLMENLYYSLRPTTIMPEDPLKYVEGFIYEVAEELGMLEQIQRSFRKFKYYITKDAFGYGPIHVMMNDPEIEEVSCVGYGRPVNVIHRKFTQYDWLESNVRFPSEEALGRFVQRLAQKAGKSVTVAIPFVDAMTKEGHRIAVTFGGEVTLPGSSFCIRKFPVEPLSMGHIIRLGTLSPLMASYLWLIEEYKGFILVVGPMSSGKTTMVNCLLTMIPPVLKIVTVEDTPELKIPHKNWERFKVRRAYSITETKYDVDLFDLVKLSLRYRPDYISVGEIRGEEAKALIQAASLGHGAISTLHAEGPKAAFIRLTTAPMNVERGSLLLISAIVTLHRIKRPSGVVVRRVVDISEVVPNKRGEPTIKKIFSWDPAKDTFRPATVEEVVAKSEKLKTVAELAGWSKERLIQELKIRTKYLTELVEEGKISYSAFSEAMRQFYKGEWKA